MPIKGGNWLHRAAASVRRKSGLSKKLSHKAAIDLFLKSKSNFLKA